MVVFAGLALVSGLVVNKRQAKQLVELETKLEQQREVTAKAEVRLEEIRQKQEPRTLDIEAFRSALKDKPKCDVQIVYQPNDNEAYLFANAIMLGLHDWARPSVPAPSSIEAITDEILESLDPRKDKPEEATKFLNKYFLTSPAVVRAGATSLPSRSGVFVGGNKEIPPPIDETTPYGALITAFKAAGIDVDPAHVPYLPDNKLRIIVGPKP